MPDIDTAALKDNFAAVAANGGDDVALYFYSYLFLRYPQTRDMFPPAMTKQRDRLVGALVRITTPLSPDETPDAAQQRLLPFAADVMPLLDRYIPR